MTRVFMPLCVLCCMERKQCILPCPAEGRHGLTVCKKTFILIAVRQVLQKLFAVSDYPYPEGKEMKP